jgi:hypothetical protein
MKRMLLLALTLAFCVQPQFPTLVHADDKPSRLALRDQDIQKDLRTDFYGVYLLGKKVGFAKMALERKGGAQDPAYVATTELSAKFLSLKIKSEMSVIEVLEFDAKPPYTLRGGSSRETDGKTTKEVKLTRTDQGYSAVVLAGGEKIEKQIAGLDYTLADVLTPSLWLRQGPPVGATLTTRSFDFDELKTDREIRKLVAVKTSVVEGVKVTYQEVEVTMGKEGLVGFERYDQQGERLLSMKFAGQFELRLEPEKHARNTEYSADLFVLGTVKIDKPLGITSHFHRPLTESLVIEVIGKEGSALKSGPRQTVAPAGPDRFTCKLGKAHGIAAKATAQEIEDSLAETTTYPISHPKVRALARKAVGDAKTPKEKVERLVHFVAEYITPSYTAQPLSLFDLLKGKKGDCTEFALLFTTLARASGIPTREVTGLLYMGDDQKAFGPHAWNEVVLDGLWVPVDASADQVEVDPTHISFGSGLRDGVTGFLLSLGKLSFKLVEVKRREK